MTMKYAVATAPGVFSVEEREIPQPGRGELLVRVAACGLDVPYFLWVLEHEQSYPVSNFSDWLFGHEAAGIVEAVGPETVGFAPGDRITWLGPGFCEYATGGAELAVKVPDHLVLQDVLGEPMAVVLHTLAQARGELGQTMVVVGAGYMGLSLILGAELAGAGQVVAIDPDSWRLEQAQRLGAHHVFRPESVSVEDLRGLGCDEWVVIEASGAAAGLELATKLSCPSGKLVIHGYHERRTLDMTPWHVLGLTVVNSHPPTPAAYRRRLAQAMTLLGAGRLSLASLITHRFGLSQLGEAYQLIKSGQPYIKIVIEMTGR